MEINFIDIQNEEYSYVDPDSATSFRSDIKSGILFTVFLDTESEEGDILIKLYNPDSTSEKFFCVDTGSGGIDFFEP